MIDRAALISAKGQRVDGTCEWIQDHETYKSWRSGETQLLIVTGGPGKGKTVLSIFLTQELEKEDLTIYYFCASNTDKRNNVAAVLRGLIWQTIEKTPRLEKHLSPYLSGEITAQETLGSPDALWIIFAQLFQYTSVRTTYCVLDGLDELDADSQRWLMEKLTNMVQNATLPGLKLLVVSRHISGCQDVAQIVLDPDNDVSVGQDIQLFIGSRVDQLAEGCRLTERFQQMVKKTLTDRAEGTFLWVGFAMTELLKKKTATEIEKSLAALPRGLPGIYDRILRQIEPEFQQICRSILQWVTLAVSPLSLPELAAATDTHSSRYIDTETAMLDRIKMCGPIITVQDGKVNLVHQSAKDYLLRDEVHDGKELQVFRCKAGDDHSVIASYCLKCVERSKLQHELVLMSHLPDPEYEDSYPQHNPLLRYAVYHWPEHARSACIPAAFLAEHEAFLLRNHNYGKDGGHNTE